MITKDKTTLQDFANAAQYEWLETNGLGGWSGSSVIGVNTRRYHGLLVAAIVPPTDRMVLLSKLDETLVTDDKRIELGVNLFPDDIVHPLGYQYLDSFSKDFFPQWEYEAEGVRLKKTIAMMHGENTVVILYEVVKAPKPFALELLPLIAAKNYHGLTLEGAQMHWDANFANDVFHNQPDGKTDIFIGVPGASYHHQPRWFHRFQYSVDQYRGQNYTEDLFNHGIFSVELKEGDSLGIIVSTENPGGRNAFELLSNETARRKLLISDQPGNDMIKQLIVAADQFIVKRDKDLKTIIAGYHWFTDWGRDTMISLPGLCLSTGRFSDARKIIAAFAKSVSRGMLPNRFQDNGEEPEYNNVDGTLWYFIAVYKYWKATDDTEFVLQEILPVLKEIIDWHYKGTRFNIHVDENGFLYAGETGQQLTWMDARIGDWVVTPRMGNPVEIQALWYNALQIFSELLQLNDQQNDALIVKGSAEKLQQNFVHRFWYSEGSYLYDNIDENGNAVPELRPNQLFAISLPFALIKGEKAKAILKTVEENLYTPVGLRSLAATNSQYIPVYGGDQWHRDAAYHQGTVWSWLLGAFVDGIMSEPDYMGPDGLMGKEKALKIIEAFSYHLSEGCTGSVSEIFDAEKPHRPRGCVAQAWGVAEVLRVMKDYRLFEEQQ